MILVTDFFLLTCLSFHLAIEAKKEKRMKWFNASKKVSNLRSCKNSIKLLWRVCLCHSISLFWFSVYMVFFSGVFLCLHLNTISMNQNKNAKSFAQKKTSINVCKQHFYVFTFQTPSIEWTDIIRVSGIMGKQKRYCQKRCGGDWWGVQAKNNALIVQVNRT